MPWAVVSAGRTLDTELATALNHLRTVHARPLGVILNRVSKKNVAAGNYGHYGYSTDTYVESTRGRGRATSKNWTSASPE